MSDIVAQMNSKDITPTSEGFSSGIAMLAKKIDKKKALFFLYGLLDGLDIIIKNILLFTPILTQAAFSYWMLIPEYFYLTLFITGAFALLAAIGNTFYLSKSQREKQLAAFWQSVRDPSKTARSACISIVCVLAVIQLFTTQNLSALLLPIALPVVTLAMLNRIWRRNIGNQQKAIQKNNQELLKTLQKKWDALHAKKITEKDYLDFVSHAQKNKHQHASKYTLAACFLSGFIEASLNGPYMFMRAYLLASFSFPGLIFITASAIVFIVLGVLSKFHEEIDAQNKLLLSEQAFLLTSALYALELSLQKLDEVSDDISKAQQIQHVLRQYETLKTRQKKYYTLCQTSVNESVLLGLRYGVGVYQAIMTGLILTSVLNTIVFGALLPEVLVIATIATSIVTTIGLLCRTVKETLQQSEAQQKIFQQKTAFIQAHVTQRIHPRYQFIGHNSSNRLCLKDIEANPLPRSELIQDSERTRSYLSGARKPTSLFEFCLVMSGENGKKGFEDQTLRGLFLVFIAGYALLWAKDADNKVQKTSSGAAFKSPSPALSATSLAPTPLKP
ncbi:MAG: hypothetical protein P1U32_04480 [Legionellaceae bacterium]|nr:hypothetical protein [Legionellaceae bacterium]